MDLQQASLASTVLAYTPLLDQEKGGTEKFKGQVLWPLKNGDPSKTSSKWDSDHKSTMCSQVLGTVFCTSSTPTPPTKGFQQKLLNKQHGGGGGQRAWDWDTQAGASSPNSAINQPAV